MADAETDEESGEDGDDSTRGVEEGGVLLGVAEGGDQGCGVGCDDTGGDGDLNAWSVKIFRNNWVREEKGNLRG